MRLEPIPQLHPQFHRSYLYCTLLCFVNQMHLWSWILFPFYYSNWWHLSHSQVCLWPLEFPIVKNPNLLFRSYCKGKQWTLLDPREPKIFHFECMKRGHFNLESHVDNEANLLVFKIRTSRCQSDILHSSEGYSKIKTFSLCIHWNRLLLKSC